MPNYKMSAYIYRNEEDLTPIEIFMMGNDIYQLKSDLKEVIFQVCITKNLSNHIFGEFTIETIDNVYCDGDEFEFDVNNRTFIY